MLSDLLIASEDRRIDQARVRGHPHQWQDAEDRWAARGQVTGDGDGRVEHVVFKQGTARGARWQPEDRRSRCVARRWRPDRAVTPV